MSRLTSVVTLLIKTCSHLLGLLTVVSPCLVFETQVAAAELALPTIFSDGMVLQRNKPVPVWGKATPGNSITITFNGQNLATTADDSGNWKVILSPMTAGGPFVMSIRQAVGEHLEVSCRKIGAQPLICVNITPSPTMTNVVQDACDFIEYCNGSVTSKWGAIRAANGHPEPYNVRQWEIGNE